MFRLTPRQTRPSAGLRVHAFTLIELLSVIAIIGILSAILVPVISSARNSGRSAMCASNLRQIGTSFQLYATDNRGLFPAPRQPNTTTPSNPNPNPNPSGQNWQIEVSPYLIRGTLANGGQTMTDLKNVGSQNNVAHCPSYDLLFNSDVKLTSQTNLSTAGYGMNFGLNVGGVNLNQGTTSINKTQRFLAAALVNPAKTILVGDSSEYFIDGSYPAWVPATDAMHADGYANGAPTRHGSTANYLFCDGHVAALHSDTAYALLQFKP